MFDYINRIDELCAAKKWTYYELSKRAGLAPNTIYSWKAKKSIPKVDMFEKISDAFGITLELFFSGYNSNQLSEEETEVLRRWNLMSEEEKECVLYLMDTFDIIKENQLNQ